MPYLVLSDLHGNREALEAVLQDANGRYGQILCLGDLAGYGADPNFTVDWVREHATALVRGNHDKACAGLDSLEYFNPAARVSAEWTRDVLESASVEYLRSLPRGPLRYQDFDLTHGSPADEDEYLLHEGDAFAVLGDLDAQLTFFGHTHVQGGFLVARTQVRRIEPYTSLQLEPAYRYLVNPGSVGQPRDGDPRAAYAIYTPEQRTVEFRRVSYDIAAAAGKILSVGLPPSLAERLYEGM